MTRDSYTYKDFYKNRGRDAANDWKERRVKQMEKSGTDSRLISQFVSECNSVDFDEINAMYHGELMNGEQFDELCEELDFPETVDNGLSGIHYNAHWFDIVLHGGEVPVYVEF